MRFWTYREIGTRLLNWGWSTDDVDADIKTAKDDRMQTCLLAAVLSELQRLNGEVINLRQPKPKPVATHHDVADGTLLWLKLSQGDKPLGDAWEIDSLSARARNVLRRSGFKMLSEITPEKLHGERNCGPATTDEIMGWVKSQRNGQQPEPSEEDPKPVLTRRNDLA